MFDNTKNIKKTLILLKKSALSRFLELAEREGFEPSHNRFKLWKIKDMTKN